jgi:hypothetical protein
MKSSDWVALGGVIISILAFGVAYLAYRLQARSATSDSQKELADQIDAIHARMAELERAPSPGSMAAITQNANVNGALQALLLRASNLIASARLSPDWYQNLVLASAAVQIGDILTAVPYAERAVTLASRPEDSGWDAGARATAQVISLRTQASVYFNRGLPGDLEQARADFKAARQVVRDTQDRQGPSITKVQLIELYVRQSDFELDVGSADLGTELTGQACQLWLELQEPGARRVAGAVIFSVAQQRGPAYHLLTGDFVREWDAFLREQGGAVPAAFPAPAGHSAALPGLGGLRPIKVGSRAAQVDAPAPAGGLATPAGPDR